MTIIRQQNGNGFSNEKKNESLLLIDKKIKSISHIEDLPNEIFYEIFTYFDILNIYQALYNINIRFQSLLTSIYLPIRVNFSSQSDSTFQYCRQQFIIPNKHRIISLHFTKESHINLFFKLSTIDSSFNRLESLILKNIASDLLQTVLIDLKSLPRLISLTIDMNDDSKHLNDIYQHIFSLPALKYTKISLPAEEQFDVLPLPTHTECSTIEHLVIDYPCSLDELIAILSYTPKLNCLICTDLFESDLDIEIDTPVILLNLTHLIIKECYLSFIEFEIFLKKISSPLQVLRIYTYEDDMYVDPVRWEDLILKYIPNLYKLEFSYHLYNFNTFKDSVSYEFLNRFTSPFWIGRRWIFELEIDYNDAIYSIRSSRKRWFENNDQQTSIQSPSVMQLSLMNYYSFEITESMIDSINSSFNTIQFNHLNIDCTNMAISTFIQLIHILPNLDSLRMSSCPKLKSKNLSDEEIEFVCSLSNRNIITKMNLDKIENFEQIQFLINLCPRIQYLLVTCTSEDVEKLVRFILTPQNTNYLHHLFTIDLYVQKINDEIIEKLQKLLRPVYTIKRLNHRILLQRK